MVEKGKKSKFRSYLGINVRKQLERGLLTNLVSIDICTLMPRDNMWVKMKCVFKLRSLNVSSSISLRPD